jgi:DNA/RNA endonuclease YhcR with UshA esterase domain
MDDHHQAASVPPALLEADETGSLGHCPSCGRFVGPYERCPYCGAELKRRLVIRLFKYGSLVLAVAGVALLLLMARQSSAPVVEIGRLAGTMNYAHVRIEGTVTRQPVYDPEAGTLRLWVSDGTGEMMVMAYRSEAEWLRTEGQVPVMGDGVALEGTLRIREEFPYLALDVPQHTEIRAAKAVELPIGQVDPGRLYERVTVRGMIRDDRTPYEGLRLLTLRDASGEIDVALDSEAAVLAGPWPEVHVGQPVQVTGAVDVYRGTPQIAVGRGSDLAVLDEAIVLALERPIGELGAAALGDLVTVEGILAQMQPFSAGVKGTLEDGSGTATLLLWQDLYDSLPDREALVEGVAVRVLGELAEYRGELEIVPELTSDIAVVALAERSVPERRLRELSTGDVGRRVRVEGVLQSMEPFSAGARATLDDGTGKVTLLLWEEVYNLLSKAASLKPGAVLQVEGEVDEYNGELEIVPRESADVTVVGQRELPSAGQDLGPQPPTDLPATGPTEAALVTPGPTPEPTAQPTRPPTLQPTRRPSPTAAPTPLPETRTIAAITSGDAGSTFTLAQAQIADLEYFSKGVRYGLTDGTGHIVLLMWQNVLEEMDARYDLFPGSRVRVVGEIDEYQGELEIAPRRGVDVVLLSRGERPPIEARTVRDVTPSDEGRIFIVEGKVARIEGNGWLRVWIHDGTGEILIFLPARLVAYLPPGVGVGVRLRVMGEVDIYNGQLEIIPLAGVDVEVR